MRFEAIYQKFWDEYEKYLIEKLSKKYTSIPLEDIKKIVDFYKPFPEEEHITALEKTIDYYNDHIFYKDVYKTKKALEKEYGRELTDEEVEDIERSYAEMDLETLFEIHPELYKIYNWEMYDLLEDRLEYVKHHAEVSVARTLIEKHFDRWEIKLLEELEILDEDEEDIKFAEAILKGEENQVLLNVKNDLEEELKKTLDAFEKIKVRLKLSERMLYYAENLESIHEKLRDGIMEYLREINGGLQEECGQDVLFPELKKDLESELEKAEDMLEKARQRKRTSERILNYAKSSKYEYEYKKEKLREYLEEVENMLQKRLNNLMPDNEPSP